MLRFSGTLRRVVRWFDTNVSEHRDATIFTDK
jgi:hypothetical protein